MSFNFHLSEVCFVSLGSYSLSFTVVATVAGCVPVTRNAPVAAVDVVPVAGQCHVLSNVDEYIALSESRPAVPCSSPHRSETFAVVPIPAESDLSDSVDLPTAETLAKAGHSACDSGLAFDYVGAGKSGYGISW